MSATAELNPGMTRSETTNAPSENIVANIRWSWLFSFFVSRMIPPPISGKKTSQDKIDEFTFSSLIYLSLKMLRHPNEHGSHTHHHPKKITLCEARLQSS